MCGRLSVFLMSALFVVVVIGCNEETPTPVFIRGDAPSDGDADGDVDGDGDADPCVGEDYPCGPYGNQRCDTIADTTFVPVNDSARAMAGQDGLLDLSDIYADESVVGILLFGTAGWCYFCGLEAPWLNEIYESFQDIDGMGHRVEFVAVVFEDDDQNPATVDYSTSYAQRKGFPFPAVADTTGDVLFYFDSQGAPGNILIDATAMRIQEVIQGFDQGSIQGALYSLDGSVNCN